MLTCPVLGENGIGKRMTTSGPELPLLTSRPLAEGLGWRVTDITCRAGPYDRSSEEQFDWTTVAIVVAGSFTYRCGAGTALMPPHAMLLGQMGACFECGHEHGTGDRCVAFQFTPDYVDELLGDLKAGGRPGFNHPRIPPVAAMLPLLAKLRTFHRVPFTGAGEQIALDILTQAYVMDQTAVVASATNADKRRVSEAARRIETDYATPLTLASLAAGAGIGRRRFATVFRRATGVTPYQYILNHRLNAAARQLEAGESSVLAVALDVGFGDLSEFTRAFCRRFAKPPALFRQVSRAKTD